MRVSDAAGAGVKVREPEGLGLQPYGQTNIVFEVGQRASRLLVPAVYL